MRFPVVGAILLATLAMPAAAQSGDVERRIGRLESEMRAVQRKVFPGGNVEPEIRPVVPEAMPMGSPATSAVADLVARVDALEAQLERLTGQTEENSHRLRQLESALTQFRSETEARLAEPRPERETSPEAEPETAEPSEGGPEAEPEGDPAETAYIRGYRQWERGEYAAAQKTLEAMAKQYPKHLRASWARNLAGRAYLDGGKPATAARILLANYEADPKGERAADSLFFLGQALMRLDKAQEACKVYEELEDVYGSGMRSFLKQNLPIARREAKCG